MTKIDHEKRNREDKAKRLEPPISISGICDQKTFQGRAKPTFWGLQKQELAARDKAKLEQKQKRKGRKQCPYCKQWIYKGALERHIAAIHEQTVCPICDEKIVGRKQLNKHLAAHGVSFTEQMKDLTKLPKPKKKKRKRRPKIGRDFSQCPQCKKFIATSKLEKHLTWHESASRCPECGKQFKKPTLLADHILKEHGETPLVAWTKTIRRMS